MEADKSPAEIPANLMVFETQKSAAIHRFKCTAYRFTHVTHRKAVLNVTLWNIFSGIYSCCMMYCNLISASIVLVASWYTLKKRNIAMLLNTRSDSETNYGFTILLALQCILLLRMIQQQKGWQCYCRYNLFYYWEWSNIRTIGTTSFKEYLRITKLGAKKKTSFYTWSHNCQFYSKE
jgi:hypothetical protein